MTTQTFNYDGTIDTFTVPNYVTSLTITAYGAQGGRNRGGTMGGLGGVATGTLSVTPGQIFYIGVGGVGGYGDLSGNGGYISGGLSGTIQTGGSGVSSDLAPSFYTYGAGGGGGLTFISTHNTFDSSALIVAGGGGGRTDGGGGGGVGGGLTGGTGGSGSGSVPGGYGGTQAAGGVGGIGNNTGLSYPSPGQNGSSGSFGLGGYGGVGNGGGSSYYCGSGGGGGWYGGGGGGGGAYASGAYTASGGGGGSSYIDSSLTGTSTTSGVNSGNGSLVIAYTIPSPVLPTIIETGSSSISQTTAILGGYVVNPGNATITDNGVCWGTYASPRGNKTSSLTIVQSGAFVVNTTGLPANTNLYYCAYGTNSVGTAYSSDGTFTTLSNVTTSPVTGPFSTTGAIANGIVGVDGGANITARGFCVSTSSNPDLTSTVFTTSGTTGAFSVSLSGLTSPNTTYHVRAYATNAGGTTYGQDVTFVTQGPTITAISPNNGSNTSSTLISSITGINFVSGCTVSLIKTGQTTLQGYSFTFTNQATLSNGYLPTTGAVSGAWNVIVTNPDGQTSTSAIFLVSTYVIGDTPISVEASNYKWLTGTLLSAQQSLSTRPYINCQIIDQGFREVSEPIAGSPLTLDYGGAINAPDGTILVVGRDTTGNLRFGKITDASSTSQWRALEAGTSGTIIATTWTPYNTTTNLAMNASIAVSNWINGSYVIDIYFWVVSGSSYTIVQSRSLDQGATFTISYTLPSTAITTSTNKSIWLVAGKPQYNPSTGHTSSTVYYLDNQSDPYSYIKYLYNPNGSSSWSGTYWVQWPLFVDTREWHIHSFDVLTISQKNKSFTQGTVVLGNQATYLVWSGYHGTLSSNTNYGLYMSRLYNLSGDSTISDYADNWGEAISLLAIEANSTNNVTNFYYPALSWDGDEIELVSRGDVITSIDNGGVATVATRYFLWSSIDGINFTYPLQLVDTSGNSFPNTPGSSVTGYSSYKMIPQSIHGQTGGNYYVLVGNGIVWQYEYFNTIADISNYIISYSISEQSAGTSSITLTIDNSNSQWYGPSASKLGASAIANGSLIYIKQGYFNAAGKPESVPKSAFYISTISQNVSTTENDLVITGVDYNYLLQSQTTGYTYTFTGPDMYYDIFNGSSIAQWQATTGTWTQKVNPSSSTLSTIAQTSNGVTAYYPQGLRGVYLPLTSGTPDSSPVLSGTTLTTLLGYSINRQESVMSVCAYIPTSGEVDIYPFYIDPNNYVQLAMVGTSGTTFTVKMKGTSNGIGTATPTIWSAFNTATPVSGNTNQWYTIYIHRKFLQGNTAIYDITIGGGNLGAANTMNNFTAAFHTTVTSSGVIYPSASSPTIALGTGGTWSLSTSNYTNYGFGSLKFMQYDYSQDIEQLTKKIGTMSGVMMYNPEHDYDFDTTLSSNWMGATTVNKCLSIPVNGSAWQSTTQLSNQQIEFDAKVSPTSISAEYAFEFLFRCPSDSLTGAFGVRFGQHANTMATPLYPSVVSLIYHDGGTEDTLYGGYQLYSTAGQMSFGSGLSYDIPAPINLNIDWTQWHHYTVAFSAGWVYVYVDDRMIISYYLDYSDLPSFVSGYFGFNTKTTTSSSGTTCAVLIKNVYAPTFWNQINSFTLNPGDDFQNALSTNLSTMYGYHFSDLMGRLKMIKTVITDPVSYGYGSSSLSPNYQLISQTINSSSSEYVNEVVVVGDGVSAIAQDAISIGVNAVVRTKVITDLSIQTVADATTRAKQELTSADKYGIQPSPKQTINVGSELFDVVNVVDNTTANSTQLNGNYRIYVQSFSEGGTSADYTMTFSTGNISNNNS